jgi:hypothetical protein
MKYILTITLALFTSMNAFSDSIDIKDKEISLEDALDHEFYVNIYTSTGKKGYELRCADSCNVIAGELCKTKGYSVLIKRHYTVPSGHVDRWVIECNE